MRQKVERWWNNLRKAAFYLESIIQVFLKDCNNSPTQNRNKASRGNTTIFVLDA